MFFDIEITGEHADELSWVLFKHPQSQVERKLGERATLYGRFVCYTPQYVSYHSICVPREGHFLDYCRKQNLPNYVLFEEHGVTPVMLGLIPELFQSAIKQRPPTGPDLDEAHGQAMVDRVHSVYCQVGPVATRGETHLLALFEHAGYGAKLVHTGTEVGILHLWIDAPVWRVLQQVYILLMVYSSHRYREGYKLPPSSQVESFVKLCAGWLSAHPDLEKIVWRLTRTRDKKAQMLDALGPTAEPAKDEAPASLNEERYYWFLKRSAERKPKRILDAGCGSGNLLMRFAHARTADEGWWTGNPQLIGLDIDVRSVQIARHRVQRMPYKVLLGNIMYPTPAATTDVDAVALCEVLEHIDPGPNRDRLLDVIFGYIQPQWVWLTTPNRGYNQFYGLDGPRHRDHRIEYSLQELGELATQIRERYGYDYTLTGVGDVQDGESPTYAVEFQRVDEKPRVDLGLATLDTPITILDGYEVRPQQIYAGAEGYNSRKSPLEHVVSLAPTMSPPSAQTGPEGFLEHPTQALVYYRDHGVTQLRWQQKYMGSRCLIVVAQDDATWIEYCGALTPHGAFAAYSRGLYPFFEDDAQTIQIRDMLQGYMRLRGYRLLALDAEVLPWSLKGEGLIAREFQLPGEAALTARRNWAPLVPNATAVYAAHDFLRSLANYTQDRPLELRVFEWVLAIDTSGTSHYGWQRPTSEHELLSWELAALGAPFQPVIGGSVDDDARCCAQWLCYCADGGEGYVFKPERPEDKHEQVQPAIKCRGQDYLRIIYGVDYLNQLDRLRRRGTNRKRSLALRQQALTRRVTELFATKQPLGQRLPYIFGFLGLDQDSQINATL